MKLKTPLRYPGGKSRATKKLAQFLPNMDEIREFREPFLGGGSVALYMTQMYPHLSVWVNDLYVPLVDFWQQLQSEGQQMRDQLIQLKYRYPDPTSAKVLFLEAKEYLSKDVRNTTALQRAISFYIVNKCSFSGLTEASSFSKAASESNFSVRGIDNLPYYQQAIRNWKITNYSYQQMIAKGSDLFIYLDPPYDIKDNLYGRKGNMHSRFNHDTFAADCNQYKDTVKMMVSYNTTNLIKERFVEWSPYEYDHTYTMRSVGDYMSEQKERKELVLINYGIRSELPLEGLSELNQSEQEESSTQ
ncbi:type II N-methyl DNA methyltransferase (group alpha) [Cyanophage S-RIM14]|uniref:site-specific DNA-methyltransferase (adenine-specific) n=1 Tax=Cyanophage S-RIM14 TaxID=1278423 RepID=A0A1D7SKR9_9CAUD|nr:type II N-methyl DNA methyltransferase (group alpha) [Cyanophage S-RIM14]